MLKSKYFKVLGSSLLLSFTIAACRNTTKGNNPAPAPAENKTGTKVEEKLPSYIYS